MRGIVRLAVLLAIAVGGHHLWNRQLELQTARQDLDGQRRGIEATEADLDRLDRALDDSEARLAALDAKITSIEREHPSGIPPSVTAEYSRLVADRNAVAEEHNALVARQRELRGTYEQRVDGHNARVAELNAQAARGPLCALLPASLQPKACAADE